MNEEIEEALNYDPLLEAEKLTGKDYKECLATTALGFDLMRKHADKKEALLFLNQDTSLGKNLSQQLEVLYGMGFKLAASGPVGDSEDRWRMLWRPGILVFFDSYYRDDSINSGKAYFYYHGPRKYLNRCSSVFAEARDGENVWEASLDIREGFRHTIESLEQHGKFITPWPRQHSSLWLLHYEEDKDPSMTSGTSGRRSTRLQLLPESVRRQFQPSVEDEKQ